MIRLIRVKPLVLVALASVLTTLVACSPAVAPAPTPIPKVPVSTPGATAAPAKPAASTPTPPTPTPAPKPAALKFGSTPTVAFGGVYVTEDKGYFKEQGITAEILDFQAISDLIAPLATGQLDVVSLPVSSPLLVAIDRGADMKIVASGSLSLPGYEHVWILLRTDLKQSGKINSMADLKGQKIAIPSPGGLGEQAVQITMEQAGLKPTDLDVTVLPFTAQVAALSNKAVPSVFAMEPNVTQSIQQDLAVKWIPLSSLYGGKVQSTVIVFGPALLKDRELAQRWMIAYLKGSRDYLKSLTTKEGRQGIAQILAKHTPVKDLKVYDDMELPYMDPNGALDAKSQDLIYKWLKDKGLYTGSKSLAEMTDTSYIDYAVQKLGKQ